MAADGKLALVTGAAGFDADDAMLLVPLAVWSGLAQGLLEAAAAGAPVFALFLFL